MTADNPKIAPELTSELAQRLHAQAAAADREAVAAGIARLFGRLACAGCGTSFTIAENLAGVSES